MSKFSRGYSPKKIKALIEHAESDDWTQELFKLWCPPGTENPPPNALRLAFRNDTINLYRKGQSVAKVGLSNGKPWLEVHCKYALADEGKRNIHIKSKGSPYIRMGGNKKFLTRDGKESDDFKDIFLGWIRAVDGDDESKEGYSGLEKGLIEDLLCNPINKNVIDLEVGIPGLNKRMDLATIEDGADGKPCVFFAEVKHFRDGRMRKAALKGGTRPDPDVISDQLLPYGNWLKEHQVRVGEAYIEAARQMQQLWDASGREGTLPDVIRQAAECETLAVCEFPRLIVISSAKERGEKAYSSWGLHERILREKFPQYPLEEIDAKTGKLTLARHP